MCHGRRHLSEGGVALWAGAVGAFKSEQRERGRESTALLVFQPCALSVRVWELGATAAVGESSRHSRHRRVRTSDRMCPRAIAMCPRAIASGSLRRTGGGWRVWSLVVQYLLFKVRKYFHTRV